MNILMTRPNLCDLPPVIIPEGYKLVTACEIENLPAVWSRAINEAFGDQNWTEEYVLKEFITREQFDPAGAFFILYEGHPVAMAFRWRDTPEETVTGRVHYVATVGDHRGKGLARAVVVTVLHSMREQGLSRAVLTTQPYRLPAIRLYMSLGFEPTPRNEEEQAAWQEVGEKLQAM